MRTHTPVFNKFSSSDISRVQYSALYFILILDNSRVWICNKVAKSFALRAAKTYASAFALRQRMLNCVQNLEYYMMVEVIEPNWVTFFSSINKVNHDYIECSFVGMEMYRGVGQCLVWILTGTLTALTDVCGFLQSLQINAWIIPQLDHTHFFPRCLQFIFINLSIISLCVVWVTVLLHFP